MVFSFEQQVCGLVRADTRRRRIDVASDPEQRRPHWTFGGGKVWFQGFRRSKNGSFRLSSMNGT